MELNDFSKTTKPKSETKRYYPIGKRWKQVKPGSHTQSHRLANELTMNKYYLILDIVKTYYLPPGTTYFERDYKDDNSEPFQLHCFVCEQFYFYLECDLAFIMQIHYDHHHFEFDAAVQKLLTIPISLNRSYHQPQQPSLPVYFQNVCAYQPREFIQTL